MSRSCGVKCEVNWPPSGCPEAWGSECISFRATTQLRRHGAASPAARGLFVIHPEMRRIGETYLYDCGRCVRKEFVIIFQLLNPLAVFIEPTDSLHPWRQLSSKFNLISKSTSPLVDQVNPPTSQLSSFYISGEVRQRPGLA